MARPAPFRLVSLLILLTLLFGALGVWQVHRLAWKEALIARVERMIAAAPTGLETLPDGPLDGIAYRRLRVSGTYLPEGTALVTGTSTLGSGYWVLVPLRENGGRIVYVNRGFVPAGTRLAGQRKAVPAGPVTVVGLLRVSEPAGTWLRDNVPTQDRWYSRDVAAIAARRLILADPRLFVDAQVETPSPAGASPVAGLTVVQFPNSHLAYALTWFALAVMCVGGAIVVWRKAG
ncbi:SURF1 family protein [Novosphingobium sp. KCTC 2891]|nr:SURF1 family protein [Novosphingobium sp. KCTC 2891]